MCKILSLSWPLSCKYAEILWKALNMHGAWEVEVSKNRAAVCEAKVEFLFYQWRQKLRCWPMASEDKSSFAPVTSKLLLLNFSGKIKTNGVGAREQICLIRISTIRPSPAQLPAAWLWCCLPTYLAFAGCSALLSINFKQIASRNWLQSDQPGTKCCRWRCSRWRQHIVPI